MALMGACDGAAAGVESERLRAARLEAKIIAMGSRPITDHYRGDPGRYREDEASRLARVERMEQRRAALRASD